MKIKIHNVEYDRNEQEISQYVEHVIDDASEKEDFLHFLFDYIQIATVAGDACKSALVRKLRDCLYLHCHCHKPLSEVRPSLEKELESFRQEALRHHDLMKQKFGPMAITMYPL